jgi:hypothetical protein
VNVVRSATAVALLLTAVSSRAVTTERNLWTQLTLTGPLAASTAAPCPWRYTFDTPHRWSVDTDEYAQGTWRAGLGYVLSPKCTLWAGGSVVRNFPPYARVPYSETRWFQQLSWSDQANGCTFAYRLRLEQRHPETGSRMGLRLRHQFRVSHPLPATPRVSWILWDEIFHHLNHPDYGAGRGLDQNRVFAGVGWNSSEIIRQELGYLHQWSNRVGRPNREIHALSYGVTLNFR